MGAWGVTLLEAAEATLDPNEVVAMTVKEYSVSLTSPVTVQDLAPVVLQVKPPGFDETV